MSRRPVPSFEIDFTEPAIHSVKAIDFAIRVAVAEAKSEGRRMVERAREQTERDFAFFRRSCAQKFRWIRFHHNGGSK